MKNIHVIEAFSDRLNARTTNLNSNGNYLVNYSTVLAQYDDGCIIVNMTKYSKSTSTIQNKLLERLTFDYGKNYLVIVDNVPMNARNLQDYVKEFSYA